MAHVVLSRSAQITGRLSNLARSSASIQRLGLNDSIPSLPCSLIIGSYYHRYRFTDNISFLSEHRMDMPKNFKILKSDSQDRPLILFFSWLKAKERNCAKYIEMYTDLGYDVLRVGINPGDLWRPEKRMHVVAGDVANFLDKNEKFRQIMVHGMSVGAYAFCEIIHKLSEGGDQHILDRFVGQIWDSPVDVHSAPIGTSKSMTENPHLQKLIQAICTKFMELKHEEITRFYYKASDTFHKNYINVPGLFLVSKIDPVSDLYTNNIIVNKWKALGTEVDMLCFEDSPHVLHMRDHKDEYEKACMKFLRNVVTIPPVKATVPDELPKEDIALNLA